MHRPLAALTLVIALFFVVPSAWADQRQKFADDYPSDVASVWFDTLYELVKSEGIAFPEASRIYGMSAVALYEAIVPGALHHRSLVGQLHSLGAVPHLREPELLHWPTVANAALAATIRGLFWSPTPENLKAIDDLEERFAAQFRADITEQDVSSHQERSPKQSPRYERSVKHGRAVAEAILAWASTDGFSLYNNCPYVPALVRGAWEPTPPNFLEPQQPCWGKLRPMVLTSEDECAPPGHPKFSKDSRSEFYAAAFEVYRTGLKLTKEQKTIAQYWADGPGTGTSSGHWIAIVGQIARNDGLSLAAAAEAYAKLGIAVADAFITIFHAKYVHNLVRPATYIQDNIDDNWLPYLVTPPNPSYSSGHSTQSMASATVLTDLFGDKVFTDTTHTDHHLMPPQKPRTFSSFNEAAAEAAVSRLYGGIHYAFDNNDGRSSGLCVGRAINNRVHFKD
jgi:membrane-associated phospholipid phosphatase